MNALTNDNITLEKFFDSSDRSFTGTVEDIFKQNFFFSLDGSISEEKDSYRLEIGVPGMTRKDITLTVDDNVMCIWAQKEEKDRSDNLMKFSSRQFKRSFQLPADADINNIAAKCRNGLLEIRIGKERPNGSHRVIEVSGGQSPVEISNNTTSWWTRLVDKVRRLLNTKRV